jgi:hypothetical protein
MISLFFLLACIGGQLIVLIADAVA